MHNSKEIKKAALQKERKFQRLYYRWLIILGISFIVYHYLLEPVTIGRSSFYNICVVYIPVGIGLIGFAVYRRTFLRDSFSKTTLLEKILLSCYFLVQGILMSYVSFGQLAHISWNIANQVVAGKHVAETISCDIRGAVSYKLSYRILFTLGNNKLSLATHNADDIQMIRTDPDKYVIVINVQQGIWDHYLVNNYTISAK